jgi:hypothetical protein
MSEVSCTLWCELPAATARDEFEGSSFTLAALCKMLVHVGLRCPFTVASDITWKMSSVSCTLWCELPTAIGREYKTVKSREREKERERESKRDRERERSTRM